MADFIIRNETKKDHAEVENLIRESFWNVYRPGSDHPRSAMDGTSAACRLQGAS